MATLKDYMWKSEGIKFSFEALVTGNRDIPLIINGANLKATIHFDLDSNAIFVSWHIPSSSNALATYKSALDRTATLVSKSQSDVRFRTPPTFEWPMDSQNLKFTGRVFIYGEDALEPILEEELLQYGLSIGLLTHLRGPKYLEHMTTTQPPLAFISHSSNDKDSIARPIAEGLSKLLCPVWYDEYSLKVGDRLRESIEKGIKECKRCILIITPNYLANLGWAKTEFDGVFSKEHIFLEDCILPIWSGVTAKEVYEYSPSMANRVALNLDNLELNTAIQCLHVAIQQSVKKAQVEERADDLP